MYLARGIIGKVADLQKKPLFLGAAYHKSYI
jgi:hypothetical protein